MSKIACQWRDLNDRNNIETYSKRESKDSKMRFVDFPIGVYLKSLSRVLDVLKIILHQAVEQIVTKVQFIHLSYYTDFRVFL